MLTSCTESICCYNTWLCNTVNLNLTETTTCVLTISNLCWAACACYVELCSYLCLKLGLGYAIFNLQTIIVISTINSP